jgi:NADPH-dependent 2,4-dienoyl-CoA reductase/sulfur reductase-like enzyme
VHFDQLVIATGADPIRLPGLGEQLTLRTAADADQLRERLVPGAHVVVVGASWIGAEVATAALSRGARVTCIEAGAAPYAQALGAEAGLALLHWWHEVELRLGVGVRGVEVRGVEPALATAGGGVLELTDGAELVADVVVSGVGVRPATSWLTGSGLTLDPAVVVDEHLRTSVAGIVALGDVASWWSARWQRHLRVMHWDDAQAAPAVAAASLLADSADDIADGGADVRPDARAGGPAANSAEPYDPVPYFWSDQFGHKLQYVGHHEQTDQLIRRTAADGELEGIGWLQPSGELTAYLAIDRPRHILHARRAIMRGAQPDPSRLADPAVPIAEL